MYRTIDARFWSDPKVRKLPSGAKLLFLYLITNPHSHPSGIYHLPMAVVATETGLSKNDLRIALDTLSGSILTKFDPETELFWVVNMYRYQCRGGKLIRSAAMQLLAVHKSRLVSDFMAMYPEVCAKLSPFELDRVSGSIPSAHSEQEQERKEIITFSSSEGKKEEEETGAQKTEPVEVLPQELSTDDFRLAWAQWVKYRRERKLTLTASTRQSQLRKLAGWGNAVAVAAIAASIEHGWQGLFEPKNGKPGQRMMPGDAAKIMEEWEGQGHEP